MIILCKYCGEETNNGTNFCNKRCRELWQKQHEARGAKRRKKRFHEDALMQCGPKFDMEGNAQ